MLCGRGQHVVLKLQVVLQDFSNEELLKKGLYKVELGVHGPDGLPVPAVSCRSYPLTLKSQSRGILVNDSELGAQNGELSGTSYTTRTVLFRFADEVFELDEALEYDVSVPAAAVGTGEVRISTRLHRCEARVEEEAVHTTVGAPPPAGSVGLVVEGDGLPRRSVQRVGTWAVVSERTLALPLSSLVRGVHVSCAVVFDSLNLASTTLSVHSAALGLSFHRPDRPPRPSLVPEHWAQTLRDAGLQPHEEAQGEVSSLDDSSSKGAAKDGRSRPPSAPPPPGLKPGKGASEGLSRLAGLLRVGGAGYAGVAVGSGREGAGGEGLAAGLGRVSRGLVDLGQGFLQGLFSGAAALADGTAAVPGRLAFPDDGVIPHALVLYLQRCAEVDGQAHSVAEALFPSFAALKIVARSARLSHLYGALLSGYVALADGDVKAADSALSAALALADSIERREAVERVASVDEVRIRAEEAQEAHKMWLHTLVDACVRVRLATCKFQGGRGGVGDGVVEAGSGGQCTPAPLPPLDVHGAGSYCVSRYGPRTRHPPFTCERDYTPEEYAAELAVVRVALCRVHYTSSGEAVQGEDAPGAAHAAAGDGLSTSLPCDAYGVGAGSGVAPFALRASAALAHAEALSRAVQHEQRVVEEELHAAWRRLKSALAKHQARVDAYLQARYRALSGAHVLRGGALVQVEERGGWEHIAFSPLAPPASRSAHARSTSPPAVAALEGVWDGHLLDPSLQDAPKGVAGLETTYRGGGEGGQESSSARVDKHAVIARQPARDSTEIRESLAHPSLSPVVVLSDAGEEGREDEAEVVSPWTDGGQGEGPLTSPDGASGALSADYFLPARRDDGRAAPTLQMTAPVLAGGQGEAPTASPTDVSPAALRASPEVTGRAHVVVFLNGLGGNVHDARVLRGMLKVHEPHLLCLGVTSNQGAVSEGCLVEAGGRVAREVASFLSDRQREDGLSIARLSFVGFSLGGIVARVALRHPLLHPYSDVLHAFVTLASPHLGLLFTPAVVGTSLYLLQQVRATPALAQLTLADGGVQTATEGAKANPATAHPAGTFSAALLYLLCVGWTGEEPSSSPPLTGAAGVAGRTALHALQAACLRSDPNGAILGQFNHVVLLASPQDSYAPYHSTMAGMTPTTAAAAPRLGGGRAEEGGEAPQAAAYRAMLHGFWVGVDVGRSRVARVAVRFPALDGASLASRLTVDSVLGREAHIAFLETEATAVLLAVGLRHLWAPQDMSERVAGTCV